MSDQLLIGFYVENVFSSMDNVEKRRTEIEPEIEALIDGERHWYTPNLIEQLTIGLLQLDKLRLEADRRLVDAEALALPSLSFYTKEIEDIKILEPKDDTETKAATERLFRVVLRLVNDCQRASLERILKQKYASVYVRRLYWVFVLSFLILLVTLWFEARPDAFSKDDPSLLGLAGFWLALVSGLFGAGFSMISQSNKGVAAATLDEIQIMSRWVQMVSRISVGAGGAAILYFIFSSRLIDGVMFPDLNTIGFIPNDGFQLDAQNTIIKTEQPPGQPSCLIPDFDGAIFSIEWKDALWDRYCTEAPKRQRQSVEQYKIVKRV